VGRPRIGAETETRIRQHLAAGTGMLKTARLVGVGSGTVQKVARAMTLSKGMPEVMSGNTLIAEVK
jgi:hypothetical protein